MIAITSPAKTQDFESDWDTEIKSQPEFLEEAITLRKKLKDYSKSQLEDVLNVSENLAELNYNRFQEWVEKHTEDNSKPAILAYQGDIYKQFQAEEFTEAEQEYLQSHLRILTGFYGILRPYDLIQAYRLEMKTKLKVEDAGTEDLYEFWEDKLTDHLNEKLKDFPKESRAIINLASNEYVKAVNPEKIDGDWIEIEFRQKKEGELKNYGIYAKKARGAFIKFMVKNNIRELKELQEFNLNGYEFLEKTDEGIMFVKEI
jgi:hypothetical protein